MTTCIARQPVNNSSLLRAFFIQKNNLRGGVASKGFTIIELLVVVVVIAILAAIALVSYNGVARSATESSLKSDLKNTATKLGLYKVENGSYPVSLPADLSVQSGTNQLSYSGGGALFCLSITTAAANGPVFNLDQSGVIRDGKCETVWLQASAGNLSSFAVTSSGQVFGWGHGIYGMLGDGSANNANTPTPVAMDGALAGKVITQVSAGDYHSIALTSDGQLYSWGLGTSGQLGNGSSVSSPTPVPVTMSGVLAGKTVVQVSAGYQHSMALTSDGEVFAWGAGNGGSLGNGFNTATNLPVPVVTSGVLAGKSVTQIVAGFRYSLALTSDGEVFAWGIGSAGQLGNGSTSSSSLPVAVDMSGALAGKTVVQIATGKGSDANGHSIALTSDGQVFTWGNGSYGKLGNGSTSSSNVPIVVTMSGSLSGKTVTQIAGGSNQSFAVTSDGQIHAWGRGGVGALGTGSYAPDALVPVSTIMTGVLAGKTITKVTAGGSHALVLSSDGKLFSWGYNNYGQVGNGTNTSSILSPVAVLPPL